jgi:hypothetical protein
MKKVGSPEEFLGEPEAVFVAQAEHEAEVVERADRAAALVGAAKVEHEAPGGLERRLEPLDLTVQLARVFTKNGVSHSLRHFGK